jgi:hypothetical protein
MPSPRTMVYARAAAASSGGRCFLAMFAGALLVAWLLLATRVADALDFADTWRLHGHRGLDGGRRRPCRRLARKRRAVAGMGFAAGILGEGREAVSLLDEVYSALAQRSPA